uniref:Integrase, catalytic region, zinc finger, CCHC-type, peptidase aspartic, catalytic n=1 Tax=Tanacetum cinerariifolium TaxID=118510 RepID=A0A6L2NFL0_TANCI|nr:hypothetical protein [Tanacetum cinerariifolium]
MTTLAKNIIVAGAENRHPMLEKSMYNSWVIEDGQTRLKKYSELTEAQQLQDDYDVEATNIILHGHSPDVLYNLFDKFVSVQGESLYEYYWRFSQLINDMHTIGMTMQQVQVNTKFLNALPSKWSKFVTDVKLAKSFYTINYDQLPRNAAWFKEKLMLVEAQEAGQILDEEQLTFLAYLGIEEAPVAK